MRRTAAAAALCLALFLLGAADKKEPEGPDFKGLRLRGIGPALMSGRIADIAIHPEHRATWYVAVGSGGVWKTTNRGTTWEPIFDDEGSYSIGCVTLDPSNPEVVWVGTGENVSGRHVGFGDGVYKSLDGGKSWKNVGLAASEHIAKIVVDPRNSNVIWVAAEGPLWSSGGERGVYKSVDGGVSWTRSLAIDDDTGVTDLEFDPRDPDVLYAAAYQRRRTVWSFLAGGPGSGIHKSTDGGTTWRRITNGLPKGDVGKIGLAVSPVDPAHVFATIEADADERGFYRSTDAGESWEKRDDYVSGGTGPHYYQEIYASPHARDRVYQMDVWIHVTDDGGATFRELGENSKHSDNHALAFDPAEPEWLLAGSDGGLYESFDLGQSWRFVENLPVTQFYKLATDNDTPFYNIVGGTQDNGTQAGPSRTATVHGIRNQDWTVVLGADGHACAVDPGDPDTIYAEWQVGNLRRYDRRSGETLDIQPQPAPGDPPERWNWDAPLLISPHSRTRIYHGSQRLWRSDDRGDSWRPISGDLSRGDNRYELEVLGRVWSVDALYDHGAMSWYGNLTAIAESPRVEGLIWVGTDDGLIQVTEDGGANWKRIDRLPGVPERFFVQEIKASFHDPDGAFVVVDHHKSGDTTPYVFKTTDRGRSWTSIRGDLPDRHIGWSIEQDHVDPDLLFLGTEFGIYFTRDGGRHWVKLAGGPTIAFRDLEIQRRENDLVGASFGRGFWILDDYTPLRHADDETLARQAALFPVKDALLYVPATTLAVRDKGYMGGSFFTAPNPPFGAVFTYHLKDELKGAKAQRHASEKRARDAGDDVPFPGWDALREERKSDQPQVVLTVRDSTGRVVRRLEGPAKKGFQRVAWDLRGPSERPTDLSPRRVSPWGEPPRGPLVPAGTYTVTLAQLEGGVLTDLDGPRSFEVQPIEGGPLAADGEAVLAFQRRTAELRRLLLGAREELTRAESRVLHLKQALLDAPAADPALLAEAARISARLSDLRQALVGDRVLADYEEPRTPSILDRVDQVVGGHWNTLQGPTATHRDNVAIAERGWAELGPALKAVIETDLVALERAAEAAGAPWTPGRSIPD